MDSNLFGLESPGLGLVLDSTKVYLTTALIYSDCDRSAVLTVEMGVLTEEEKLIQVDMLRLEVGSKRLRADELHESDVEGFGRAAIVER